MAERVSLGVAESKPEGGLKGTPSDYGLGLSRIEEEIMTLLACAHENPKRFQKIRTKALLKIANIQRPNPQKAIRAILSNYLEKEAAKEMETLLLSGKISPYEAVGLIKENSRKKGEEKGHRLTSGQMTSIWTQLSLSCALAKNEAVCIPDGFSLEKEITENVVIPKGKALKESLSNPAVDGRYYETRPHLKSSTAKDPNWAEILGNLPHSLRECALILLQSSEKNPRFQEAAKALAWPNKEPAPLAENQRLNALLHRLGARAGSGRAQALAMACAALPNPPVSIEIPEFPESPTQASRRSEILQTIENLKKVKGKEIAKNPAKNYFDYVRDFVTLKDKTKTLHPSYQKEIRAMIDAEIKSKIAGTKTSINWTEMSEEDFETLFRTEAEEKASVLSLLRCGHATKQMLEELKKISPEIDRWLKRELSPNEGPKKEIILSALEGKAPNTTKTFGSSEYTLLHVASWWKSPECLEEMLLQSKEKGAPLFPKTKNGATPAFYCERAGSADILVSHKPNLEDKDTNGNTPLSSVFMQNAVKKLRVRENAKKAISGTADLEI